MKKFIVPLLLGLWLALQTAHASERIAVVELFTSQGCSSCPPADAFLGELSKRKDVLALAYHVDYWDYIGWNDVHAKAAFTQRQRLYARTFNLRYIYTPQMIVSGEFETSGNKKRSILQAVEEETQKVSDISMSLNEGTLFINGDLHNDEIGVYHVSFHKEVKTKVKRGENMGKTLTDFNIVKDLSSLGEWRGGEARFDLVSHDPQMGQAIFLQRKSDLKILGAVRVK